MEIATGKLHVCLALESYLAVGFFVFNIVILLALELLLVLASRANDRWLATDENLQQRQQKEERYARRSILKLRSNVAGPRRLTGWVTATRLKSSRGSSLEDIDNGIENKQSRVHPVPAAGGGVCPPVAAD